jgi:hypothetical protein
MKTPRQNWLAAFLIVCALLTPTHIQALEDIPAVPYKDVPEIVPYIQQDNTVETGDENINVAKVDLSSPPDGISEYIIQYNNGLYCGSGGCTTEVVRIKPSGKIEQLAGILSYGFSLAYTHTNGLRDLLSVGRSGEFTWRFNGKEYKSHKGHPRAATTAPNSTPVPASTSKQSAQSKPRTPGCVKEYGWSGGNATYSRLRDGYASFTNCTDPMNRVLTISCRSDQGFVEIAIAPDMGQGDGKKTMGLLIEIDGKRTTRLATLAYSEMAGHSQAVLRLKRNDPLFRALARGKVASIAGGKKRIKVYLKGAARAIRTMRRGC